MSHKNTSGVKESEGLTTITNKIIPIGAFNRSDTLAGNKTHQKIIYHAKETTTTSKTKQTKKTKQSNN
jgi:hypothetical protein